MRVLLVFLCVGFFVSVPFRASAAILDQDKDGLSDALEQAFGSDSTKQDTDGDGFTDGNEVRDGFSPVIAYGEKLAKRILVDLSEQKLSQELGGVVIATHKVSTGKASTPTPVGTFSVKNKHPRAWSRSAKLWMPYWMAFTWRGHGLHELPEWPGGKKEGAAHLGIPVSHGCIRLGIGAAKTLYEWSSVGTPVVVVR